MAQFYDDKVPDGLLLAFSSYGMRHGKNISPVGTGVRALYRRRIALACPSFIEHFQWVQNKALFLEPTTYFRVNDSDSYPIGSMYHKNQLRCR